MPKIDGILLPISSLASTPSTSHHTGRTDRQDATDRFAYVQGRRVHLPLFPLRNIHDATDVAGEEKGVATLVRVLRATDAHQRFVQKYDPTYRILARELRSYFDGVVHAVAIAHTHVTIGQHVVVVNMALAENKGYMELTIALHRAAAHSQHPEKKDPSRLTVCLEHIHVAPALRGGVADRVIHAQKKLANALHDALLAEVHDDPSLAGLQTLLTLSAGPEAGSGLGAYVWPMKGYTTSGSQLRLFRQELVACITRYRHARDRKLVLRDAALRTLLELVGEAFSDPCADDASEMPCDTKRVIDMLNRAGDTQPEILQALRSHAYGVIRSSMAEMVAQSGVAEIPTVDPESVKTWPLGKLLFVVYGIEIEYQMRVR